MNTCVALQVDYVEPSQNTISLKMIPRIDLDRIKAKMSLVGQNVNLIFYLPEMASFTVD